MTLKMEMLGWAGTALVIVAYVPWTRQSIGTAMIGYRHGDVIEWEVPSGVRRLRVEEVLYQPESKGEYHL